MRDLNHQRKLLCQRNRDGSFGTQRRSRTRVDADRRSSRCCGSAGGCRFARACTNRAVDDEPIPLADALHFDQHYMQFLNAALTHKHARVRSVARAMIETLDHDVAMRRDVSNEAPIVAMRRYFGFNGATLKRLRYFEDPQQNSNAAKSLQPGAAQKSKCRSSSDL